MKVFSKACNVLFTNTSHPTLPSPLGGQNDIPIPKHASLKLANIFLLPTEKVQRSSRSSRVFLTITYHPHSALWEGRKCIPRSFRPWAPATTFVKAFPTVHKWPSWLESVLVWLPSWSLLFPTPEAECCGMDFRASAQPQRNAYIADSQTLPCHFTHWAPTALNSIWEMSA